MTVRELIDVLRAKPQGMSVIYRCCSEWCMLEARDITFETQCLPRDDGWVQNKRPDKSTQEYLAFPGN